MDSFAEVLALMSLLVGPIGGDLPQGLSQDDSHLHRVGIGWSSLIRQRAEILDIQEPGAGNSMIYAQKILKREFLSDSRYGNLDPGANLPNLAGFYTTGFNCPLVKLVQWSLGRKNRLLAVFYLSSLTSFLHFIFCFCIGLLFSS